MSTNTETRYRTVIAGTTQTAYCPDNGKGNPRGFEHEDVARNWADKQNAEAEKMGLVTRYEVAPVA
jgi:hypothetical protein